MRPIDVGTVIEQVRIGVPTGVEVSPALLFERPDGKWVAPGPELDGIARHVSDVAVPMLLSGMVLTNVIPAHTDLTDNGETMPDRLRNGGKTRAHERVQDLMAASLVEALQQDWHFAPVEEE